MLVTYCKVIMEKYNMRDLKVENHNYLLDIFKLIAALFVVIFHVTCHIGSTYIIAFFSYPFAVPLFFAISGFFSFKRFANGDTEYFKRKIIQTLKLYLICSILYTLFYFSIHLIKHNFLEYFTNALNYENIIKLVVLNKPIFSGEHIWFILALLYVYIYVYVFLCLIKNKKYIFVLNLIFSILLMVGAAIIDISFDFSTILTRNWLFYGLPCFFIGIFIGKYKDKIKNIKLIHYLLILVLSIGFRSLVKYYSLYYRQDISIFIIIFSVSLLCISIKYENLIKENKIIRYFGELSMYVYIIHWGVLFVVENIVINYTYSLQIRIIGLIAVLFISLVLSYLYIIFKEKILKSVKLKINKG